MLDAGLHQTTGLNSLFVQPAQHVIVMASNGDWHGELPLLWNLSSAWSIMGLLSALHVNQRLLERAVSVRQDSFDLTQTYARALDPFSTARKH